MYKVYLLLLFSLFIFFNSAICQDRFAILEPGNFSNGVAIVKIKNASSEKGYTLINKNGNVLFGQLYKELKPVNSKVFLATTDSGNCIINFRGKEIVGRFNDQPKIFNVPERNISIVSLNKASYIFDNREGYLLKSFPLPTYRLDSNIIWLGESYNYDFDIYNYSFHKIAEHVLWADPNPKKKIVYFNTKDQKAGIVKFDGTVIVPLADEIRGRDTILAIKRDTSGYSIITVKGKVLMNGLKDVRDDGDNDFIISPDGKQWNYLEKGKLKFPGKNYEVLVSREGKNFFLFGSNEKIGMMNKEGKELISPKYVNIEYSKEGKLFKAITKDSMWLIDEPSLKIFFKGINKGSGEIFIVSSKGFVYKNTDTSYQIFNRNGQQLSDKSFKSVRIHFDSLFTGIYKKESYLFDHRGKVLVSGAENIEFYSKKERLFYKGDFRYVIYYWNKRVTIMDKHKKVIISNVDAEWLTSYPQINSTIMQFKKKDGSFLEFDLNTGKLIQLINVHVKSIHENKFYITQSDSSYSTYYITDLKGNKLKSGTDILYLGKGLFAVAGDNIVRNAVEKYYRHPYCLYDANLGKVVSPDSYLYVSEVSEGLFAMLHVFNEWSYFDLTGKCKFGCGVSNGYGVDMAGPGNHAGDPLGPRMK